MLALFEVLSFKGWLDVRDVLIKALGPVNILFNPIRLFERLIFSGARHLHTYLHIFRLHDWFNAVRRGCDC